jgi:hypothetical protein
MVTIPIRLVPPGKKSLKNREWNDREIPLTAPPSAATGKTLTRPGLAAT